MSFDGKTVGEGHAASRRVTGSRPVACLQQHRVKRAQFDDFARDAVDLDPIANANAILTHQYKPSDKADDEILERDGQSCAGQSEKRSELSGRSEDDQKNE